jgi:hypothetical protein
MSISPDGCSVISSYNYKVVVVWDISYCTLKYLFYAGIIIVNQINKQYFLYIKLQNKTTMEAHIILP